MQEAQGASVPGELEGLIERARAGDEAARHALFSRCRELLLERIRWMMGADARLVAESGDFLQSTFAAALRALPEFELRDGDSFQRWLVAIARNKLRAALRRRQERAISHLSGLLAARDGQEEGDVESELDAALTLHEAFARLPEEDRRLLELRHFEERCFQDIAALLGCSERHARRRHQESLLRLSRALRDAGPGAGRREEPGGGA